MFQVLSREEWYGAIYMAQAWHKQREQLEVVQGAGSRHWRASEYRVNDLDNREVVEAAPGARWKLSTPFDSYRPTSKARELNAGPHLTFLNLKGVSEEQPDLFHKALILFAKEYGLLGAFEEDYMQHPMLPEGKMLIAPEAAIDGQGRLEWFDPDTEGKSLLRTTLAQRGWWRLPNDPEVAFSWMAPPSEIKFNKKDPGLDSECWPVDPPRQLVPWEVLKEDFGALVVLDPTSLNGVSILCTREPVRRWDIHLLFFPSGETPVEHLVGDEANSFNSYLQEVSPRVVVGKDGNLERGWRCRSLLQAMYVMLYLDLTGGNTVRKCQSRGCPNHFRLGPQAKSKYCSQRCANRASTRMRRGQEP